MSCCPLPLVSMFVLFLQKKMHKKNWKRKKLETNCGCTTHGSLPTYCCLKIVVPDPWEPRKEMVCEPSVDFLVAALLVQSAAKCRCTTRPWYRARMAGFGHRDAFHSGRSV